MRIDLGAAQYRSTQLKTMMRRLEQELDLKRFSVKQLTLPFFRQSLNSTFGTTEQVGFASVRVISPDSSFNPADVQFEVKDVFGALFFRYGLADLEVNMQGHWNVLCKWLQIHGRGCSKLRPCDPCRNDNKSPIAGRSSQGLSVEAGVQGYSHAFSPTPGEPGCTHMNN